jgi:hypothetical protein
MTMGTMPRFWISRELMKAILAKRRTSGRR